MECLACGFCCLNISPINSSRCPYVVEQDYNNEKFYFCSIYNRRPERCVKHEFYQNICPVGLNNLRYSDINSVVQRIDNKYSLIEKLEEV